MILIILILIIQMKNNIQSSLFDNSRTSFGLWGANQYLNGVYNANINYIGDSNFKGDWIIIKLPYKIVLTAYKFYQVSTNATTIASAPGTWKCYGSSDGINWKEIIEASNSTEIAVYYGFTYINTLPSYFDIPYLYIGWVFNKLVNNSSSYLSLTEIQIFGKEENSSILLNINNVININTNSIQKFPADGYDVAIPQIQTSNEIFNCYPQNVYKNSVIVNNDGIYSIYYSSYLLGDFSLLLNNKKLEEEGLVSPAWGNGNYNYSGFYIENLSYIGNNSYKGDWVIIKFPYKISMTQFGFYQKADLATSNPLLWKCYGSNDGINWIEIIEASNTSIDAVYTSNTYMKKLSKNIPFYLYIGWVINKIAAAIAFLFFNEILVYGTSVIKTIGTNTYIENISTINGKLNVDNFIQNNSSKSNIFLGSVGIGTTNTLTYTLNINGTLNANNIYENNTLLSSKYQTKINTYTIGSGATGGSLSFNTNTLTLTMPNNYTTPLTISNLTVPTTLTYKDSEISASLLSSNLTVPSTLTYKGNEISASLLSSNLIVPTTLTYKGSEISASLLSSNLTVPSTLTYKGSEISALLLLSNLTVPSTLTYKGNEISASLLSSNLIVPTTLTYKGSEISASLLSSNLTVPSTLTYKGSEISASLLSSNLTVPSTLTYKDSEISASLLSSNLTVPSTLIYKGNEISASLLSSNLTSYNLNVVENTYISGSLNQTNSNQSNVFLGGYCRSTFPYN